MKKGPLNPKGFRDILPDAAKKRRVVINILADVLEEYGFVPIETPTLEFAETLLGKYGEDEKLIYRFKDRGGRNLALRYDLTVPLARFAANHPELIKPYFSRYQIGQVFRGENPQKGRFREFTQFDFDTIGTNDPKEDARVIAAALFCARRLGLSNAKMMINDRQNFAGVSVETIRAIDKIAKIGQEAAREIIKNKNLPKKDLEFFDNIGSVKPTEKLNKVFLILKNKYDLSEGLDFIFDPKLARGLDYYTSTIFEIKPNGLADELSAGGGGRYDDLIGIFAGKQIPAVGFSFGIERLIESVG